MVFKNHNIEILSHSLTLYTINLIESNQQEKKRKETSNGKKINKPRHPLHPHYHYHYRCECECVELYKNIILHPRNMILIINFQVLGNDE